MLPHTHAWRKGFQSDSLPSTMPPDPHAALPLKGHQATQTGGFKMQDKYSLTGTLTCTKEKDLQSHHQAATSGSAEALRLGGEEPRGVCLCSVSELLQSKLSAPNPVPVATACIFSFVFVFGVFLVHSAEFLIPTESMSFERGAHLIHIFVGPFILVYAFHLWDYACVLSPFNHVWLFVNLWTIACQAPLSMEFSRQEYWSELPGPSPGHLPDSGVEPLSLTSPA